MKEKKAKQKHEVPTYPDGSRTLSAETAPQIRDEVTWGKKIAAIAREFGVAVSVIEGVINRNLYGETR